MRILITGSNGFLGRNLCKYLSTGHNVIECCSDEYDLRVRDQCNRLLYDKQPHVIIHAAGTVGGIGANKKNPGKFMYENLIMGTNMIDASNNAGVRKFIMLGTVCAYPKFAPIPFKEEDLWNGYPEDTNAPYGIAKKTLMRLVEAYAEQYLFQGVNLVPVNLFGPEDHFNLTSSHVIPALILKTHQAIKAEDKEITLWGTGKASREFLYVEDCVRAIDAAIHTSVGPEPINIGTGKEITIAELMETITDLMGYSGEIIYDSSKPDGQPRRCLDVQRAKDRLGFEAKVPLREGLIRTINWFNDNCQV